MKQIPYSSKGFTEEQREEFDKMAKPLIKWLNDNGHPHMKIIIDPSSYEVVSGEFATQTFEFVKD